MKNTKRWIAMLLALCLMLGMAACSTTNGDTPAETPTASENGNASTDNNTGSGDAATSEVTTYHILGQQGAATGDWNGFWLFRRVSEDVGVKFDVTMVSIEGLQEKKNLGLATGEYPDFYFAGILTEDDIANYGAQGIFLPLEDYINEENTPNMVKAFEKYPGSEGIPVLSRRPHLQPDRHERRSRCGQQIPRMDQCGLGREAQRSRPHHARRVP